MLLHNLRSSAPLTRNSSKYLPEPLHCLRTLTTGPYRQEILGLPFLSITGSEVFTLRRAARLFEKMVVSWLSTFPTPTANSSTDVATFQVAACGGQLLAGSSTAMITDVRPSTTRDRRATSPAFAIAKPAKSTPVFIAHDPRSVQLRQPGGHWLVLARNMRVKSPAVLESTFRQSFRPVEVMLARCAGP